MEKRKQTRKGKGKAPQPKFNAIWIYVPLLAMIG